MNLLVEPPLDASTPQVKNVIEMTDFGGGYCGDLDYGYVRIPINLQENESSPDTIVGNEDDDCADGDDPIDYKWSEFAYIQYKNETSTEVTDVIDRPFDVTVLGPGEQWTSQGQLFNRYYVVYTPIYGDLLPVNDHNNLNAWADSTGVDKSIFLIADKDEWRGLVYIN